MTMPRELQVKINSIRQKMPNFWLHKRLNHFTIQSIESSEGVLKKFEELAKELPQEHKLSPEEHYVATAAIYLFDIGMQCRSFDTQFMSFSADAGEPLTPEQIMEVRHKKHLLSRQMIIHYLSNTDYYGLDIGISRDKYGILIADACGYCGQDIELDEVDEAVPITGSSFIRLRLIVCLIRLADQLNIDASRVDIRLLERAWHDKLLENDDLKYWWVHTVAQIMPLTKGRIQFYYLLHEHLTKYVEQIQEWVEPGFEFENNVLMQYLEECFDVRLRLNKKAKIRIDESSNSSTLEETITTFLINHTDFKQKDKHSDAGKRKREQHEVPDVNFNFDLSFIKLGEQTYLYVTHSIINQAQPERFVEPYTLEEYHTIQKALRLRHSVGCQQFFSNDQKNTLLKLNLAGMENDRFLINSTIYTRIGRQLYSALLPEKLKDYFQPALIYAQQQKKPLALRLFFSPQTSLEAIFPWELLCDENGEFLVQTGSVDPIRYISIPRPTPVQDFGKPQGPLRVLFVPARPSDQKNLPVLLEQSSVQQGLYDGFSKSAIKIETLSPATYDHLLSMIQTNEYDVVHFDCHGTFGYLCECKKLSGHLAHQCSHCGYSFTGKEPIGFLILEDGNGMSDYITANMLRVAFNNAAIKLVLISACQSSQLSETNIFSSTGTALVGAGLTSVLGMQLPITVQEAALFVKHFYHQWGITNSVVQAVGRSRKHLVRDDSNPSTWFIPTLYLM